MSSRVALSATHLFCRNRGFVALVLMAQASTITQAYSKDVNVVMKYHIQTKHYFNKYSRSLGYMDWANQPNPFRRFDGAQLVLLPFQPSSDVSYETLFRKGTVPSSRLSVGSISKFLELSLGLTAWKQAGQSKWALRSNPSSGNLHPTEGYVVIPKVDDLEAGLYHYAPKEHGLELRASFSPERISELLSAYPSGAFLMGFTSIHWREAWKYGERAFRYCNHDVGHALGSSRIAAANLGWYCYIADTYLLLIML
jgi:SagB-type dehydrogenase family enzyme